MTEPTDHPFQPGVEVAIVTRNYNGTSYSLSKVAKVYKNGNFVLEGNNQQYRASRGWLDSERWEATATGSSYGAHARVELVTDKLREEVTATIRKNHFKNVIYALNREAIELSDRATDAHIGDLRRIYAELTGKA